MSNSKTDGKVIKIISEEQVVINIGSSKGVSNVDKFLIFLYGEELSDPDTGENLGKLEIIKGKGKAIHVQDLMSTIETYEYQEDKTIVTHYDAPKSIWGSFMPSTRQTERRRKTFENVKVGDLVRRIK